MDEGNDFLVGVIGAKWNSIRTELIAMSGIVERMNKGALL